jgi:DNA-binding NarL/FixJ family response regulator
MSAQGTTAIRLLLADDHALVRDGLKRLFALVDDVVVTAEAFNGEEVIKALQQERFGLVLLDMTMPGISGHDLITRIRAMPDPPPILVLSMHNEPQIARQAIAAGASGYITKDNNPEVLLAAIRKVACGKRFIDPSIAEALAFDTRPTVWNRPAHDLLSNRERQVFSLLVKGFTVNNIAEHLSISNKTVSTHKARLMEKMGATSTADLVRYAIDNKLTDLP